MKLIALTLLSTAVAFTHQFGLTNRFATSPRRPQNTKRHAGIDGGGLNLDLADIPVIDGVVSAPSPVEPRSTGKTVLVSGLLKSKDRTDQTIFDLLKSQESSFNFAQIRAWCNDEKFAKKRLTSRSARYTGLLDVLSFVEAPSEGAMPSAGDLEGVDSYVAYGVDAGEVGDVAAAARDAGVRNVVVLLERPTDPEAVSGAARALDESGVDYTLVCVPEIVDGAEGSAAYRVGEATDVEELGGTIARDEALRLVAECLGLQSAAKKALSFRAVGAEDKASEYLKTLRSRGYSRAQEVENMILGGVEGYENAIVEKEEKKKAQETEKKEEKKKVMLGREEEIQALIEKGNREFQAFQEKKIDTEAREFLAREWRASYFSRNTTTPEEQYIEENMERGQREARRIIAMMSGQPVTEDMLGGEKHWMDIEAEEAEEKAKLEKVTAGGGDDKPDDQGEDGQGDEESKTKN